MSSTSPSTPAVERIKAVNHHLRAALDQVTDAVLILQNSGTHDGGPVIAWGNEAAARCTGIPAHGLSGIPLQPLLASGSWENLLGALPAALQTEEGTSCAIRFTAQAGALPWKSRLRATRGAQGEILGMILALSPPAGGMEGTPPPTPGPAGGSSSSTGHAAAGTETGSGVRLAPPPAEGWQGDVIETIRETARQVAHEFNNALTSIVLPVQLAIRAVPQNGHLYESLEVAHVSAQRAAELAQDFLDCFRPRSAIRSRCAPAVLLGRAFRLATCARNVSATLDLQPDLPDIEVDESQLERVIFNLVRNSIQAMPSGGRLRVTGVRRDIQSHDTIALPPGPYVQISVRDWGPGIPEEHLQHLFHGRFTTKTDGNGCGLPICYQIVRAHGGEMHVRSRVHVGTEFIIYLPAASPVAGTGEPVSGMGADVRATLPASGEAEALPPALKTAGFPPSPAGAAPGSAEEPAGGALFMPSPLAGLSPRAQSQDSLLRPSPEASAGSETPGATMRHGGPLVPRISTLENTAPVPPAPETGAVSPPPATAASANPSASGAPPPGSWRESNPGFQSPPPVEPSSISPPGTAGPPSVAPLSGLLLKPMPGTVPVPPAAAAPAPSLPDVPASPSAVPLPGQLSVPGHVASWDAVPPALTATEAAAWHPAPPVPASPPAKAGRSSFLPPPPAAPATAFPGAEVPSAGQKPPLPSGAPVFPPAAPAFQFHGGASQTADPQAGGSPFEVLVPSPLPGNSFPAAPSFPPPAADFWNPPPGSLRSTPASPAPGIQPPPPPDGIPDSHSPPPALAGGPPVQPPLFSEDSPLSLLVVDDEQGVRTALSQIARIMGFEVATVATSDEALQSYKDRLHAARPYSTVLLDLNLRSGLNGLEVFQAIRRMDPEALIVATSGQHAEGDPERFRAMGFAGFLPKPYSLERFDSVIRAALAS